MIVGESVLDVACGTGRWAALIESNYWEAGLARPPFVDGFDAFGPNVELCRARGFYRNVWEQTLPSKLEGNWDTVIACEFVEHLSSESIDPVVTELERVATRRIIFSTPNHPCLRPGLESVVGFNSFEAHLSYVPRSYFASRNYRVRGVGFGRPDSVVVRLAKQLRLGSVLVGLPRALPSLGENIVAVKDVG